MLQVIERVTVEFLSASYIHFSYRNNDREKPRQRIRLSPDRNQRLIHLLRNRAARGGTLSYFVRALKGTVFSGADL